MSGEMVHTDPEEAARRMQALDSTAVVMELAAIGRELDRLSHETAEQDEKVVRALAEHRKAYAREFTSGAGSIEDRKQAAILAVDDLRVEAELAEQVLRAMKERVKVLRDRLEIGRSIGAAVRSQFAAESTGQYT